MAVQPIGAHPGGASVPWDPGSSTFNRANLLAGIRAGLIALVLLTVLAAVVLL